MTAILATTKSLRTTVDGTLVVSFEIAPQDAPAAFVAFGLTGTNVGIAPITDDAARDATVRAAGTVSDDPIKRTMPEPLTKEEHRQNFTSLKRTAQAAIRCGEREFWSFLHERYYMPFPANKDDAAGTVRALLDIPSRSVLNTDDEAAAKWDTLEGEFYAWQHGRH